MRALVYTAPFTLQMQDVAIPTPGPGEVVVKVDACGVCGADVEAFRGKSKRHTPPIVLGHEISGEIASIGAGGRANIRVGQKVVVDPLLTCGSCEFCQTGHENLCLDRRWLGVDCPGGQVEYVLVPESAVVPAPEGFPTLAGVLVEPLANAVHLLSACKAGLEGTVERSIERSLERGIGGRPQGMIHGTMAIFGTGTVGMLTLALARLAGMSHIFAVDVDSWRLQRAKDAGADLCVNADREDPVDAILKATDGRGVDVTVETAGAPITRSQAIEACRAGGTAAMFGWGVGLTEVDYFDVVAREIHIHGYCGHTRHEFIKALDLLAGGRIDWQGWVSRYPLANGQTVYEGLARRDLLTLKAALEPYSNG